MAYNLRIENRLS